MTPGPHQPIVELTRWDGPWDDDDRDANFKHDVALYSRLDPLSTIENLSTATGIPVGSLCRYILAKWAAAGAEALMAMGPSTVIGMSDVIEAAEASGTDEDRLQAYRQLAEQISWLRYPLDHPEAYP